MSKKKDKESTTPRIYTTVHELVSLYAKNNFISVIEAYRIIIMLGLLSAMEIENKKTGAIYKEIPNDGKFHSKKPTSKK